MNTKIRNKLEGFTIIEVMIVLAIAGLIMLIVFLAIPALQRNSKNTQYRSEAANITSAVQEYITNNNGSPLVAADTSSCADAATCAAGSNTASKIMQLVQTKNLVGLDIKKYDAGPVSFAVTKFTTAYVRWGAKCNPGPGIASDTQVGSGRSISVIYPIEDAQGNPQPQCINS